MTSNRIKITFVIPSLAAGGAERILSFVAKNLSKSQFDTTLLVIGHETDTVYDVTGLNVIYLNRSRVMKSLFSIVNYLKNEKPQIVLSSIYHLNVTMAFLSYLFKKTKFIAREANVLSVLETHATDNRLSLSKSLIRKAYQKVDCLICQSKDMQQDMIKNYGVALDRTVLINNPITHEVEPKREARQSAGMLQIITVGRLSKEKGHDRIIEVLSKLEIPFHYNLIGNGPEQENVTKLIQSKSLEDQVTYTNYTSDVESFLRKSDIFLQGSYSEGFPNALIESCVVGTPIVAFKAPGGIDEIIETGKNGYIVESIEDCVDQLTALFENFTFHPKEVNKIVVERFNSKKIISQYENLFLKLTT